MSESISALLERANYHLSSGNVDQAEIVCKTILDENPHDQHANYILGVIAVQQNRIDTAFPFFEVAVRQGNICPAAYYYNYGLLLVQVKQFARAVEVLSQAVQHQSTYVEAYAGLGYAHRNLGNNDDAIQAYKLAIKYQPKFEMAYVNLGEILWFEGRNYEALEFCKKAIALNPKSIIAYHTQGNALLNLGEFDRADKSFRKSLALQPGKGPRLDSLLLCSNYNPAFSSKEIYDLHCEGYRGYSEPQVSFLVNDFDASPLRIGYVSPDFRNHSVAFFIEPLLKAHDRNVVEVYCYSSTKSKDDVTERLMGYSDHWTDIVGLSGEDVAGQVRGDRINILVDLCGHTRGNRLDVFAQRAAPVQVTWLGYPNTTGLPSIDYRLTDSIADPIDSAGQYHTEELIRLPGGFLCYMPPALAPPVAIAPSLSAGYVTFGCFNNLAKLNRGVVTVWAEILRSVPGSKLVLKALQFSDQGAKDRCIDWFSEHGIERHRILMYGLLPSSDDYLAFYDKIDIALDTFPYNGTTTTCEALFMGVPVVTLFGDRHASRVSASILNQIGHYQWAASDTQSYIETAVKLAGESNILQSVRENLRNDMLNSRLCDGNSFSSEVEEAYQNMWSQYLSVNH